MKNRYLFSIMLVVVIVSCCLIVCSCATSTQPNEGNAIQQLPELTVPTVAVSHDGTITWNKVQNANRYIVYINGIQVFATSGFSYNYSQTDCGTYSIQVVATDYLKCFRDSMPSETVTYVINTQKLITPQLFFDGETLSFNSIVDAQSYCVYVDKTLTDLAVSTSANIQKVDLSNLSCGLHVVEVKALGNGKEYIDSDISSPISVFIADNNSKWNAETMIANWTRNTEIAITKPNATELMFWVDADAYKNSYIENYIAIPVNAKSFVISCFASSALENAVIDLQIRKFDGEYEQMTIRGKNSLILSSDQYDKYFFAIPSQFIGTKAFIKITVNTAGTYQTQAVFKSISFSENTEFVQPEAPLSTAVMIKSTSQNKYLQYDVDKGYLVLAGNTAMGSAFMLEPANLGSGYFRIKTQNGLYLTKTMFLTEGNVAWDYIIQAPYQENLMSQIWSARYVEGSDESFTIINYGTSYDDNGVTKYLVLNAYYPQLDNVCVWYDITAADLEFEIEKTTATFSDTSEFITSQTVDFSKPIFAYFAGRNAVLTMSDSYMVLGNLISTINDFSPYAWTFETAQDGYCYIKNNAGNYLCTQKVGTSYFVTESAAKDGSTNYLFKAVGRGGNMFYLSNKYVDEDSRFIQYMVYDVVAQKIGFYTDLITNADQILKFVNIER